MEINDELGECHPYVYNLCMASLPTKDSVADSLVSKTGDINSCLFTYLFSINDFDSCLYIWQWIGCCQDCPSFALASHITMSFSAYCEWR